MIEMEKDITCSGWNSVRVAGLGVLSFTLFILFFSRVCYAGDLAASNRIVEELISLDMDAYAFLLGQDYSAGVCIDNCPKLCGKITYAKQRFNKRFNGVAERIEGKYGAVFNFEKYNADIMRKVRMYFSNPDFGCGDCVGFIDVINKRADGDLPRGIHAGLNRNVSFRKNPAKELTEGYRAEWKSKPSNSKLRGLDLSLYYPGSWKAKSARGKHIVQKFVSDFGYGSKSFMIVVNPGDGEPIWSLQSVDAGDVLAQMDVEHYVNEAFSGGIIVNDKMININNQRARKLVVQYQQPKGDVLHDIYCEQYFIIYDGNLIQMLAIMGKPVELNLGGELEKEYDTYKGLFERMASSLYIHNQFE